MKRPDDPPPPVVWEALPKHMDSMRELCGCGHRRSEHHDLAGRHEPWMPSPIGACHLCACIEFGERLQETMP